MRLLIGFFALVLAGLTGVAASSPAWAQLDSRDAIALQNQILELRRDVQSLRAQLAQSGTGTGPYAPSNSGSSLGSTRGSPYGPPPGTGGGDMTAALLDRVSRLEEEVRTLTGRADEADNARQRMNDDLSKQIADMNFRLDNGGAASPSAAPRAGSPPPALPPGSTLSPPPGTLGALPGTPPAPPAAVRRTPELAMQEGTAALARRDYATAEAAAREVLANPRNPRAADAQFLLAQALAGRRDNQSAAIAYDDTYNRSPTGPHAQDALLGLANSLTALGDKAAACAALDKLRVGFPQPRPDVREGVAGVRARAGCR